MSLALQAFSKGTQDLLHFIEGLELERKLFAATSCNPPCSESDRIAAEIRLKVGTGGSKKQFDYNAIIVSLYGLFEQFIEEIIGEYSTNLQRSCQTYADLPERLRKAHSEMTVELLPRLEHNRYKGRLQIQQVIANMHSCLSGDQAYSLNLEALRQHSANFRADVLGKMLKRLGIEQVLIKLPKYDPFKSYLSRTFPNQRLQGLTPEAIYAPLDDLAERRNDVAHGVTSDILSLEIMIDRVNFLLALGRSLATLVDEETVAFDANAIGLMLGKPINVFNNSIVCIELRNQGIRKGDTLVMVDPKWPNPCLFGQILELQVESVSCEYVPPAPSVNVGCRVDFRATRESRYALIPQA